MENKWISVKDELPKESTLCFLCGIERIINDEAIYFRTIGWLITGTDARNNSITYWVDWNRESMIDEVTHWMLVPEPLKP